jgi:hypothetical protein
VSPVDPKLHYSSRILVILGCKYAKLPRMKALYRLINFLVVLRLNLGISKYLFALLFVEVAQLTFKLLQYNISVY